VLVGHSCGHQEATPCLGCDGSIERFMERHQAQALLEVETLVICWHAPWGVGGGTTHRLLAFGLW
jgi:hypothetical protein